MCPRAQRRRPNFGELREGEVRRIPLLRLYEKWMEKHRWWHFGSTKHRNIALWGRFVRLVGYRFDTYPVFSYSLSTTFVDKGNTI